MAMAAPWGTPIMTMTMTTTTEALPGLLSLTQWLSPAFPLGAFAYSHGLEHAIAIGVVHDRVSLHGWLRAVLCEGSRAVGCGAIGDDPRWGRSARHR